MGPYVCFSTNRVKRTGRSKVWSQSAHRHATRTREALFWSRAVVRISQYNTVQVSVCLWCLTISCWQAMCYVPTAQDPTCQHVACNRICCDLACELRCDYRQTTCRNRQIFRDCLQLHCKCLKQSESISIEQAVSKTTFYDILKLLEFPTHDVNILISLNFVHTYMEMSTTVKNPDCLSFSFMLQGTPVNDPGLLREVRGIAWVHEFYYFSFFLIIYRNEGARKSSLS